MLLRTSALALLFTFICIFARAEVDATPAEIAALEAEIHDTYLRLKDDFERNPYFSNASMNQRRNGRASPFMKRLWNVDTNNNRPLENYQMVLLPDFKFLPEATFRRAVIEQLNAKTYLNALEGQIKDAHRMNRAVRRPEYIPPAIIRAPHNFRVLTVVDFNQPAQARRLYVFDLREKKVLFNTFVAQGMKSDLKVVGQPHKDLKRDSLPDTFSNLPPGRESNTSSLGFYLTGDKAGKTPNWGYGLKVYGLDPQLNSYAYSRKVIFHEYREVRPEQLAIVGPDGRTARGSDVPTKGCFGLPAYESGKVYGLDDVPLAVLIQNTISGFSGVYAHSDAIDPKTGKPFITRSQFQSLENAAAAYAERRSLF